MSNKFESFFRSFSDADSQLDFSMAHETLGEKIPVISTGSHVLDDALSSGGLPKGRIIQYYGAPSSGKSLMTMIAMVHAQKEDPDAKQLFIDSEGTFSPSWAESLGVDTTRVMLIKGDTAINGRKCFEMLLGVPKEDAKHILKGKSKEGFLDKIANGEFNFNLIILDSLGSIIPPSEDTSAVGKANISLLSRFLTTTFRKLSLEVAKAQIPFVIINHKKANMDLYGSDHTFTGGNTYAHFLSANIYFEAVGRKDATIFDENEEKIGHTIRATIEKSKFGPCPRKCEFKVEFAKGIIDQHEEIVELALKYDVVTKPSTMSYEYGDQKWVGLSKFQEVVKENQELSQELINKVIQVRENKLDAKRLEQIALKEASLEKEEKSRKRKSQQEE